VLYRFLSLFGVVAHIGDAITGPFRLARPRTQPVAGTARVPGSLLLGVVLGLAAIGSLAGAGYADANKYSTAYTIARLTDGTSRGGKDYATVAGSLYDSWVDETDRSSGKYLFTFYLLGDTVGSGSDMRWIVVKSSIPAADMRIKVRASSDGRVALTGMLSDDSADVASMRRTLAEPLLNVDPNLVLQEGETPTKAEVFYTLAAICGVIGGLLLLSWLMTMLVGYVVFRPLGSLQRLSASGGSGLLPVRVTGLIAGYSNGTRARQLRAELRVPPADPASGAPPIDLSWPTRRRGPTGVRLTPGVTRVVLGTAYPFTGPRPAIKARFGRFDIVLCFDNEPARDAAFDQFRISGGLIVGPDGASASNAG
jgi:hypothetical protein